MVESPNLTVLIERAREGDRRAQDEVLRHVYGKLRSMARGRMKPASVGHTLQPTALVHEVYLRSLQDPEEFENRAHFFFVATRAMRDILVEHARAKMSAKRGGEYVMVELNEEHIGVERTAEEVMALDEALDKLAHHSERQHQIVMLKIFAGLDTKETAHTIGSSVRTTEREWRFARAYLNRLLSDRTASPES